nr:olfactory receptor 22 [Gregopimpla kuwanae]
MEKKNPGYVYAYGWNRINMQVIGVWPEIKQHWIVKNRVWGYASLIMLIIWIPQAASMAFLRGNLNELIDCLVTNVPVGISVMKLVVFRLRRQALLAILALMAKDWSISRTDDERNAMMKMAKYSRFISIMSVSLANAMLLAFPGFRAWSAVYERKLITNETVLAIGFLYPAYFPFDTKEMSSFLPTWFGQWVATIFSMIAYSGPDSFVAMMVLHLCGQLATVRIALVNLVDEESVKDHSIYWTRLSDIVRRHEELNRYGELLEGSFNGMLLIQMILCTITFCFQGFVTFTTMIEGMSSAEDFPVLQMVFFVTHGFYTILHLFVYCWVGDLLVVESTAISRAPYECDWFRLPATHARALMMVTNRSRIPLQMTAGKFVAFSLELFTSIMKTSMGYLSVLLAMKDRLID